MSDSLNASEPCIVADQLQNDRFLGREIIEDRAGCDPGVRGQVTTGRFAKPLRVEQVLCDLKSLLSRGFLCPGCDSH